MARSLPRDQGTGASVLCRRGPVTEVFRYFHYYCHVDFTHFLHREVGEAALEARPSPIKITYPFTGRDVL